MSKRKTNVTTIHLFQITISRTGAKYCNLSLLPSKWVRLPKVETSDMTESRSPENDQLYIQHLKEWSKNITLQRKLWQQWSSPGIRQSLRWQMRVEKEIVSSLWWRTMKWCLHMVCRMWKPCTVSMSPTMLQICATACTEAELQQTMLHLDTRRAQSTLAKKGWLRTSSDPVGPWPSRWWG